LPVTKLKVEKVKANTFEGGGKPLKGCSRRGLGGTERRKNLSKLGVEKRQRV